MAEDDKVGVKLVVVGDGAVGKTTLLMRYRENKFPDKYVPTVFENYYKPVTYKGVNVNFGLWDTAGQEEYDRLRSLSYHDTEIVLVVFSVDQPTSLDNLSAKWVPEVIHHCKGTPLLVVGTKKDLRNDTATIDSLKEHGKHPVSIEEGNAKAKEIGAVCYMECSALSGEGVQEIFEKALDVVLTSKGYLKQGKGGKKGICTLL
jgi:small GTP-binding protein